LLQAQELTSRAQMKRWSAVPECPLTSARTCQVFKYPATLLAIMAGLSVLFLADRIRRLFRHPAK
ncbi:hypothetical protein ACV3J6_22240, partial [Salmonella enterica subsp. houtenae serovar 16:z4,z23:-]